MPPLPSGPKARLTGTLSVWVESADGPEALNRTVAAVDLPLHFSPDMAQVMVDWSAFPAVKLDNGAPLRPPTVALTITFIGAGLGSFDKFSGRIGLPLSVHLDYSPDYPFVQQDQEGRLDLGTDTKSAHGQGQRMGFVAPGLEQRVVLVGAFTYQTGTFLGPATQVCTMVVSGTVSPPVLHPNRARFSGGGIKALGSYWSDALVDLEGSGRNAPLQVGARYTALVGMSNDGATTWTRLGPHPYRLGSKNPQDNATWGLARVELPDARAEVPPSSNIVWFEFEITAPSIPGTYDFQWRMVQEFVEWFGDYTPKVKVRVAPRQLSAHIEPYPIVLGHSRQYIVRAEDAGTHAPVAGTVKISNPGAPVKQFATNTTFAFAFKADLTELGEEVVFPQATVSALGYAAAELDLGVEG